jgi:hypothetical protein
MLKDILEFLELNTKKKILFIILLILIFIIPIYRDEIKKVLSNLIPISKYTCNNENNIGLTLSFNVNGVQGILGKTYYTNDTIELEINTSIDCYICYFGVDSKGINAVNSKNISVSYFKSGRNSFKFPLDSVVGEEIYYVFGSECKFNFSKDILPKIHLDSLIRIKGPQYSERRIDTKYFSDFIWFQHVFKTIKNHKRINGNSIN